MKLGYEDEVPYPDIQTKASAHKFIGMPVEKLVAEKNKFLEEIVPQWEKEAEERESKY